MNNINCLKCKNLIINKYCNIYGKKLYNKCTYTGSNFIKPCETCKKEYYEYYREKR